MNIFDVLLYLRHGDIKMIDTGFENGFIPDDSLPIVTRNDRIIKVSYPNASGFADGKQFANAYYVEYFTFIT